MPKLIRKARADKGQPWSEARRQAAAIKAGRGGRVAKMVASKIAHGVGQDLNASIIPQVDFVPERIETDEEIDARISDRFEIMGMMATATGLGVNRSLIISGPPGVGKSHDVEVMMNEMIAKGRKADHIKGFLRPTGLYKKLYENRGKDCLIVFDDCDSVFMDEAALNLLKTACDTTRDRKVSWLAETRMEVMGEAVPNSFIFEGSVIFITNYDFDALIKKGHRLAPHFEALISRSHYLDLTLKTRRDYLVRIKQVIENGMLDKMELAWDDAACLMIYIEQNAETLRELSLRMVVKLATLMKSHPASWKRMAAASCMKQ